jgi:hypothetical protein
MTSGKIVLLSVGIAGAVALGVVVGPRLVHHEDMTAASAPITEEAPAPVETAKAKAPVRRAVETKAETDETFAANVARERTVAPERVAATPPDRPELQARLKPVLNQGAKMEIAADGFRSGEQFAAVAHASKNTAIPFMLLKHRILEEKMTLAQAINYSRPELDGQREARRAQDAARYDIAVISS